ncbi:hypothetical protein [Amycolatopsis jejuensis]|uniref:hypothetical protein n=1 Tax=Amycolatopsis jejuensis TaxID=330084 RepID=UPI000525D5FF|nr:hypothetical protein [Amycolatopsis jejuensis]
MDDELHKYASTVAREPAADCHWAVHLVTCPECGNVATIEWESRIGGVLHAKVHCIDRHWFFMPADPITCFGSDRSYRNPNGEGATRDHR